MNRTQKQYFMGSEIGNRKQRDFTNNRSGQNNYSQKYMNRQSKTFEGKYRVLFPILVSLLFFDHSR